jgi:hypothetical protein
LAVLVATLLPVHAALVLAVLATGLLAILAALVLAVLSTGLLAVLPALFLAVLVATVLAILATGILTVLVATFFAVVVCHFFFSVTPTVLSVAQPCQFVNQKYVRCDRIVANKRDRDVRPIQRRLHIVNLPAHLLSGFFTAFTALS